MSTADVIADYIRSICVPLLDPGYELSVQHAPGAFKDYTYQVLVPGPQMPFLLGRGGENAEAVRRLVRARARAEKWDARIDVRMVAA